MPDDAQPNSPNQPAAGAPEPSMEEILASIRKIIADDDPSKTGGDVLELTQMVQEDGSVVDMKAAEASSPPPPLTAAAPPPPPEPVKAATPPSPLPLPPLQAAAPPPPPMPAADMLVSQPAANAAASALSSLASTVEIERLSSVPPMTQTFIGNGARTLEEMAVGLMKPMLKEWLDTNLPPIVDRLVQKEIERITKKD
jgi:uncharacterized protein